MAGIESIHVLQGHVDYYAAGPRDTLEVSVTVVIVLLLFYVINISFLCAVCRVLLTCDSFCYYWSVVVGECRTTVLMLSSKFA